MRNPPLITIIINNYNYARFLPRAIESALNQDLEVDVIVVDDGSTDESAQIAGSYKGSNYTFLQKPNGGQNSAIEFALSHVKSEYVINLDSDDALYRHASTRISAAIDKNRSAKALMYMLRKVDLNGAAVGKFPDRPFVRANVKEFLLRNGYINHSPTSGNAYRTDFLRFAFSFIRQESKFCDGYLVWAAAHSGEVECIDEILGDYLIHGSNASTVAGRDSARVLRNTSYTVDHSRHLASYIDYVEGGSSTDVRTLIDAYTWRRILWFKLASNHFPQFSYWDCARYGIGKFWTADEVTAWQRIKNSAALGVGALCGLSTGLVNRSIRAGA